MRIKQVESLVGITDKNIRFYEKEGLLHPSRNPQNGYREYSDDDVQMLARIKLLRKLSFSLEQIRNLCTSRLSLAQAMREHTGDLARRIEDIKRAGDLCTMIAEREESIQTLDAGVYLQMVAQMEKEGTRFMNTRKDTAKKYVAPILVTLIIAVYMISLSIALFALGAAEQLPAAVSVLLIVLPLGVAAAVVAAMIMRIREIQGGEEDAARKY